MTDVLIIGAGVVGSAIARELSKYELDITILEKDSDIAEGVTKANSGIVHAGYNEKIGTLKGKLNREGNDMFDSLSKDLDFKFERNGALVLGFSEGDMVTLEELKKNGEELGIKGLSILDKEDTLNLEKNIKENVKGALYAKTSGIVSPYEMTIALAENAVLNGARFKLNSEVTGIEKVDGFYRVKLKNGEEIEAQIVINAAGLYGDKINNMVSKNVLKVKGVKGEYLLLDKVSGKLTNKTLFTVPKKDTKGVLVTKTVEGNLLVGPNAEELDDVFDFSVTEEGSTEVNDKGLDLINEIPEKRIITAFSGIRPHIKSDFIIEEAKDSKNFINVIGIDSPGLTCAPAIAVYVKDLLKDKIELKEDTSFNGKRKGILRFNELSFDEKNEVIKENRAYGKLICKCELITEGEIVDAINRPLGARTVDGVKRRTRASMGGCQGVGCLIPIATIISRELDIPLNKVMKNNKNSNVIGFKED